MSRHWRNVLNSRGDTLIEVTIALAILAMVLTGAFATANKAFNLGQNAKERSQMVNEAQQQAEALQSFRDSHTWTQFVQGSGIGLPGIVTRNGSVDCDPNQSGTQHCFHMVQQGGTGQWIPQAGPGTDQGELGNQGYVRILVYQDTAPLSTQPSYTFIIQYGVPARGGGPDLASDIRLELVDMDGLR